MKASERFRGAGFTLLEVLAAVALLGLVYVAVLQGASQGMQTEGDASRRLRASLLADWTLSDLEFALAAGTAPPVGRTESSEEEFTVVVEVSPFDLASILPPPAGEDGWPAPSTPPPQLLQPSVRGGVPTLLSIAVQVAWIEGISQREVTRTSFAFDAEAAAQFLEGISAGEEEGFEEEER
jgi:prepilin-type N-terminal cleavage/methylation domain-containing protein